MKGQHNTLAKMLLSQSLLRASLPVPVFLLLLVIIMMIIKTFKRNRSLIGVPPSPPGLFLIGHLHLLGSLPHRSLRALSTKYGSPMLLRLGFIPTLIVSSPDTAKEILKTHDRTFASRPPFKAARLLLNDTFDISFAPYSDSWRQLRKLCIVHLLSTRKVKSYKLVREEEVAFMMGRISPGQPINVSELLNNFAIDSVTRIVTGRKFRENGRDEVFRELVGKNNKALGAFYLEDWFPSFGWLDQVLGLSNKAMSNGKKWDTALEELIEEHTGQPNKDEGEEMNFVDSLCSVLEKPDRTMDWVFTKEQAKAVLMDMFAAGSETTYITLEWAMTELIQNPPVLKKLQDEVRRECKDTNGLIQEEEVGRTAYLRAVIKEALRLHPSVPLLLHHESMEDCKVGGYHIPKKTRVVINAWAIGRDPKHWEEADEFRPERFLTGGILDLVDDDFKFVPFGAGRRICPGMNFAVSNLELALANLVHKFDWELPHGLAAAQVDMTEAPGLLPAKKQPLRLVAKLPPCKTV